MASRVRRRRRSGKLSLAYGVWRGRRARLLGDLGPESLRRLVAGLGAKHLGSSHSLASTEATGRARGGRARAAPGRSRASRGRGLRLPSGRRSARPWAAWGSGSGDHRAGARPQAAGTSPPRSERLGEEQARLGFALAQADQRPRLARGIRAVAGLHREAWASSSWAASSKGSRATASKSCSRASGSRRREWKIWPRPQVGLGGRGIEPRSPAAGCGDGLRVVSGAQVGEPERALDGGQQRLAGGEILEEIGIACEGAWLWSRAASASSKRGRTCAGRLLGAAADAVHEPAVAAQVGRVRPPARGPR